jgi:hypothetical protein
MSKPATSPQPEPAQPVPNAEASVLRAVHSLAAALEKVPQDTIDKWAKSSLKDYLALAAALAKLAELTQPAAARKNEIITADGLRHIEKRLNLIP